MRVVEAHLPSSVTQEEPVMMRRGKSKGPQEPWWTKPQMFFAITSGMFWTIVICAYIRVHLEIKHTEHYGLSKKEMAAVPCNPAHRPVATCAHRGNAAELLGAGRTSGTSLLQQMQMLWDAGVYCFDVDVVQLQGGDMIVGHPADLAARVDASALPTATTSTSSSGLKSKALQSAAVSAEQLHSYSLQQLRAAGLTEDAAPTLDMVLQTFKRLIPTLASTSSNSSSKKDRVVVRTAHEAAQQRSWLGVPTMSLELKGPAAVDAHAFSAAAKTIAAAGVSQYTLLWMRQMRFAAAVAGANSSAAAGAGGADDIVVVTELANAVKQAMQHSSSSSGDVSTSASSGLSESSAGRPLLGLIVADVLLNQPHLAALVQGDASKLTAALLSTAGGVQGSPGSEGGVYDAFDVLAPSIKLPAEVLKAFVAKKACLAWTLENDGHARRALWLGLDVAITNTPMAQLDLVQQEEAHFCNIKH